MQLLLDTHVLLWLLTDDPRLPADIRALILTDDTELFFSAAEHLGNLDQKRIEASRFPL